MKKFFLLLILSGPIRGMEIDYYLKNKTTLAYIAGYQQIWRENKENLIEEQKIDQGDNICNVIKNIITPQPDEICDDKQVQEIAKRFSLDDMYTFIQKNAEELTDKKQFLNARAAWSHCRYRIAQLCKEELKSNYNILLDIREQDKLPLYDETFNFEKLNIANQFFIVNNKDVMHPVYVIPYLKASLIINAINHQKAEPVLFSSLQKLLIRKAKERKSNATQNRLNRLNIFLNKLHYHPN